MKKYLFIIVSLFLIIQSSFGQEKQQKVLLLPFQPVRTGDKYQVSSENVSRLLFSSLYNYLSIFPFLDLPEQNDLLSISEDQNQPLEIAEKYKSDFLVSGEFSLSGDNLEPKVKITVKVWSLELKKYIMQKTVSSTVDLDIFDSIDKIASESLVSAFDIKSGFATLQFSDFKIGNEKYELFINNKKRADITNSSFYYSQKILGDTRYKVVIQHEKNGQVYKERISLAPGTLTNISYQAQGKLVIEKLKHTKPKVDYTLFLNNEQISPNITLDPMNAARSYQFSIRTNDVNITNYSFYLADHENKKIIPSALYYKRWNMSLAMGISGINYEITDSTNNTTSGSGLVQLNLNVSYYILPRIFLETGLYWGKTTDSLLGGSYAFRYNQIPINAGITLLGSIKTKFRLSLGISTGINFISLLPGNEPSLLSSPFHSVSMDFGAFAEIKFRWGLFFRVNGIIPINHSGNINPSTVNGVLRYNSQINGQIGFKYALF